MESQVSLPCSHEPATGLSLEPDVSSFTLYISNIHPNINLIPIFLRLGRSTESVQLRGPV